MSNSLLLLIGTCALVMLAAIEPAYAQDRIDGEVFNDPTRPILPAARPRGEPVPAVLLLMAPRLLLLQRLASSCRLKASARLLRHLGR